MYTTVFAGEQYWTAVRDNADRIRSLTSGNEILTDDHLRRIVSTVKSQHEHALMRVMLDPVQRSEKRCPFSSGPAVRALLRHVDKAIRLERVEQLAYVQNSRREAEEAASAIVARATVPTREQYKSILEKFIPSRVTSGIVEAIVAQGGLDGRYTFEIGKSDTPVIESTLGYNFSVNGPLDNLGGWNKKDVKIIVIDGVVEFVHEIHRVLELASSMKFPMLMVARGFGDDVVQTLRVNRLRGMVDCLPLAVPVEMDTLNTPKDIAVVCNSDLVSTIKGERISSVDLNIAPTVDKIAYKPGQLTITNASCERSVGIHVRQLSEARFKANGETQYMYDARIKSMSPNHTQIRLPKTYDALSVKSEAQMVANGLRLIRALHEGGVVETSDGIDIALRLAMPERFVAAQLAVIIGTEAIILKED